MSATSLSRTQNQRRYNNIIIIAAAVVTAAAAAAAATVQYFKHYKYHERSPSYDNCNSIVTTSIVRYCERCKPYSAIGNGDNFKDDDNAPRQPTTTAV